MSIIKLVVVCSILIKLSTMEKLGLYVDLEPIKISMGIYVYTIRKETQYFHY